MTDKDKNIKKEDKTEEIVNSDESVDSKDEAVSNDAVTSDESVDSKDEAVSNDAVTSDESVDSKDEAVSNDAVTSDESVESDSESSSLKFDLPFIIGKKVGMTQIFSSDGTVYPVSVIQAGPCIITQIKTLKIDGYDSVQLGYLDNAESKTTKPLLGHYKKSKASPQKHLKEFRYELSSDIKLGEKVMIDQFNVGDILTVSGTSKGKGFAGHMKRHNFSGGRASHGKNSVMRKAGSIGAGTSPGRVWKGTRMAGRMGGDKVTIKNLELVKVDQENNLLFVSGSIPGPNKNIVYISKV